MIIEWTKENVKIIPVVQGNINIDKVTLLPGCNEVEQDLWEKARLHVRNEIATGVIKELHTKVEEKKVTPKDSKGKTDQPPKMEIKLSPKEFKKLSLEEAEAVIENTFNIDTLEKWKKKESRDSIRAALMNKIEEVKKYEAEGKGKK